MLEIKTNEMEAAAKIIVVGVGGGGGVGTAYQQEGHDQKR